MLKIHQDDHGHGTICLRLEGEATVESSAELQQAFIAALRVFDRVLINCELISSIDFFVLQMLCSAHRTAVAWNKLFTFDGEPGAVVSANLRSTGFARDRGCSLCPHDVRCLWMDAEGTFPGTLAEKDLEV